MYYIVTKNSIPGFHAWPQAPSGLEFLRSQHRHLFEITCKIEVTHDDRDKEIICQQNAIRHYLLDKYGDLTGHLHLGSMSCEMLAKELADRFGCIEVTVQEDSQGGAGYVRE